MNLLLLTENGWSSWSSIRSAKHKPPCSTPLIALDRRGPSFGSPLEMVAQTMRYLFRPGSL